MRHLRPERRAHPRIALRVTAGLEDTEATVFLPTADLSAGGMRLESPEPPVPGACVRVVLELPGEPALQRLTGRVVRVARGPAPGLAVAFEPGPGLDAVRRVVERRLGLRRAS